MLREDDTVDSDYKIVNLVSRIADGFLFLFRGAIVMRRVSGAWWLLLAPILLNILIFAGFLTFFFTWVIPLVFSWLDTVNFSGFLSIVISVMIFVFIFIVYALGFSMLAELLGAPFYEEIGVRVDKKEGFEVNERPWWSDMWVVFRQEALKILILGFIALFLGVLQFVPGTGHILSVVLGFFVGVVTIGSDAVSPALCRRGYGLVYRWKWVVLNLWPVVGMGLAKMLGLFLPVLNVVVLPMAAVGGTQLVQKYDKK